MLSKLLEHGDKVAVVQPSTNQSVTFREMAQNIRRTAKGLRAIGVISGDVICMFTPNCIEYYYVFYAVVIIQGIVTTVNPTLTARELRDQIVQSRSTRLIVAPQCADTAWEVIRDGRVAIKDVFVIGGKVGDGVKDFNDILQAGEENEDIVDDSTFETVHSIPFSSGTTGKSKGVKVYNYIILICVAVISALTFWLCLCLQNNKMIQYKIHTTSIIIYCIRQSVVPVYHVQLIVIHI